MSTFLQRIKWRLAMSCGRPKVEHFVILVGFCCAAVILFSFLIYESGVDLSSAVEKRRRQTKQDIEDYVVNFDKRKAAAQREKVERERLQEQEQKEEEPSNNNDMNELLQNVKPNDRPVRHEVLQSQQALNVEDDLNNNRIVKLDIEREQYVNSSLLNHPRTVSLDNINFEASNVATNGSLTRKRKVRRRKKARLDTEQVLGGLHGGLGEVKVYFTEPDPKQQFECVKLNLKPPTMVCLHDLKVDVHVSQHIHDKGIWEPYIVRLYQNLLFTEPDLGVYDIGSHIGQYTLLAAVMGHKVVAVDPYVPNLVRVRKAMQLNNLTNEIILVQNAISDQRQTFELSIPSDNQGGTHLTDQDADRFCTEPSCPPHAETIFMDDLLEVTNFKRAIIKIDIEGHEHRAFAESAKLFESVKILYIFMEWIKLRGYYGSEADDSEDKRLVFGLISTLTGRGYTACGLVLLNTLDPVYWYGWPDDIVWQHKDAIFI